MKAPAKNTICLWYNGDAEDAARFYAETFPAAIEAAPSRLRWPSMNMSMKR